MCKSPARFDLAGLASPSILIGLGREGADHYTPVRLVLASCSDASTVVHMSEGMTDRELLTVLQNAGRLYEPLRRTVDIAEVARLAQASSTSTHVIADTQRLQLGMVLYPER